MGDVILPTKAEWYTYWQSSLTASTQQAPLHQWMCSPLFIHSFPRGQVLSLWWMGAGTGQLFHLTGQVSHALNLSILLVRRVSAILKLFRSPHVAPFVFTHTQTQASQPDIPGDSLIKIYLTNWGCSLQFHLHVSECFMPGGDYRVSSSFSGEWWVCNHGGCE